MEYDSDRKVEEENRLVGKDCFSKIWPRDNYGTNSISNPIGQYQRAMCYDNGESSSLDYGEWNQTRSNLPNGNSCLLHIARVLTPSPPYRQQRSPPMDDGSQESQDRTLKSSSVFARDPVNRESAGATDIACARHEFSGTRFKVGDSEFRSEHRATLQDIAVLWMEYQLPPQQPQVANSPVAPVSGHPVAVGVMQGTLTHVQAGLQNTNGTPEVQDAHRWSQYQHLWRQHVYMNGN
ncbi:hypothetical protein D910_06662 [Dendroctonus ponderosae]|uniref:Uncharacterized protein n=1 Tax=Dendroctonus ponderosae TaxID=77166 RepID=U4U5X0_DENPD|nr:hypothetical protein D910_06662 [Dendroctonus ponderosae]